MQEAQAFLVRIIEQTYNKQIQDIGKDDMERASNTFFEYLIKYSALKYNDKKVEDLEESELQEAVMSYLELLKK